MVIFEDRELQSLVTDIMRGRSFQRLRHHVRNEADAPSGNAELLSHAIVTAFKEGLNDGLDDTVAVARQPESGDNPSG